MVRGLFEYFTPDQYLNFQLLAILFGYLEFQARSSATDILAQRVESHTKMEGIVILNNGLMGAELKLEADWSPGMNLFDNLFLGCRRKNPDLRIKYPKWPVEIHADNLSSNPSNLSLEELPVDASEMLYELRSRNTIDLGSKDDLDNVGSATDLLFAKCYKEEITKSGEKIANEAVSKVDVAKSKGEKTNSKFSKPWLRKSEKIKTANTKARSAGPSVLVLPKVENEPKPKLRHPVKMEKKYNFRKVTKKKAIVSAMGRNSRGAKRFSLPSARCSPLKPNECHTLREVSICAELTRSRIIKKPKILDL